jgi:hypothetical protein
MIMEWSENELRHFTVATVHRNTQRHLMPCVSPSFPSFLYIQDILYLSIVTLRVMSHIYKPSFVPSFFPQLSIPDTEIVTYLILG